MLYSYLLFLPFMHHASRITHLIGLTGNIASGKSTVAALLVSRGAAHIDADALVHEMYLPGTEVTAALVGHFGDAILNDEGAVDRRALGAIVFNDPQALKVVEAITHPRVAPMTAAKIKKIVAVNPPPAIVLEAVKLIESGRYKMMDSVWMVVSEPRVQKQRLMQSRGLTEAEADARLAAQPPLDPRLPFVHVLIRNDGTLAELEAQVERHWSELTRGEER